MFVLPQTGGLFELKSQELSRNVSIPSHTVSTEYGCFPDTDRSSILWTTKSGLVSILPLKSVYCRLQVLPHLEEIFVKVSSTSSCFSGLDWQFDWVPNFHSWSFMICHATVASSAQWESPWSYKCPKGHTRIYHACADPLGRGPSHKSFLSLTGRRIFLTNNSTSSNLEAYLLHIVLLFFCFFIHAYICTHVYSLLCWRCR